MALRVVTYDFTVEQDDIGELDRRIRASNVSEIASDIEEVGISLTEEEDNDD